MTNNPLRIIANATVSVSVKKKKDSIKNFY